MLNEEICKLRDELNNSIIYESDFNKIYELSIELDELIAQFYKLNLHNCSKEIGVEE